MSELMQAMTPEEMMRRRAMQMQAMSAPMMSGMYGMGGLQQMAMAVPFAGMHAYSAPPRYSDDYTPTTEELEVEQELTAWLRDTLSEHRTLYE